MSGGRKNLYFTRFYADMERDFFLFIPADVPGLNAVLSYYTSTVKMNSEGDVGVSDEGVTSLGMSIRIAYRCSWKIQTVHSQTISPFFAD